MAAFYEYIKGYMNNGTTAQYIFFNQGDGEHDKRPYFSSINVFSGTSNADTKHFFVSEDGNHTFMGKNTFKNESIFDGTTTFNNQTTFKGETNFNITPSFNNGATIKDFINIAYKGDTGLNKRFIIKKGENTLVTFNDSSVTFEQALSSNESITARYFNALSDRHLKTNINTIEDSVLPFITSTPVYTFNYKKDPTIPVIGIMAQDVLDKNINDFNLVKKNGNGYYEIKESKMIYILWKAVQEQQKQIEALQARLEGEVDAEAND